MTIVPRCPLCHGTLVEDYAVLPGLWCGKCRRAIHPDDALEGEA